MKKSTLKTDKDELLEKALSRYQEASDYWSDNYDDNKEDVEFLYGDQWDSKIRSQRSKEGRPCLQENRLLAHVHQLTNEIRQSKPSITPKPVDSNGDVETAEVLGGLIRNIVNSSDGDSVFGTASTNAITSGFGWIRVVTDYADYDSFEQEIRLERIINPFSVLIDPNSQRMDGSDAKYLFINDFMDKDDFEEKYPDIPVTSFDGKDEWSTNDAIKITEYFYKSYETKTLVRTYQNEIKYKEDIIEGLEEILEERDVEVCEIKYCKLTKDNILEENVFLGEYIPVVPVYGEEVYMDGKRTIYTMVRQAKDPQRMFNYWITASTEIIALQPKAPWVGAKGSFSSSTDQWLGANVSNTAFLEYDIVHDKNGMPTPPPSRQTPPTGSPTMMQEALRAADGIKSTLGMFDASMGQQTNDVSGKAIIARKVQGDNANYHFIDNLSTAMKHVGRIIIGLVPYVYSGERIIRIIGEDDEQSMVALNQPVIKQGNDYVPARGQPTNTMFDVKTGKYDIIVEVGASYATKRQEAANAIIEIARVNPEILGVAGDLLMQNLDIPNAKLIAERIRASMPPELLGDDLEAQRMKQMTEALQQLQQKLEQTEAALLSKQEDEKFKNQLDLGKLENDRKELEIKAIKTMAEIEKMKAETKNISMESFNEIQGVIQGMDSQLQDVTGALDVILSAQEGKATGEPQSPETQLEENV